MRTGRVSLPWPGVMYVSQGMECRNHACRAAWHQAHMLRPQQRLCARHMHVHAYAPVQLMLFGMQDQQHDIQIMQNPVPRPGEYHTVLEVV